MSAINWSVTVGGSALSWTYSLIEGSADDAAVSEEVRESWGSFELIVDELGLWETV